MLYLVRMGGAFLLGYLLLMLLIYVQQGRLLFLRQGLDPRMQTHLKHLPHVQELRIMTHDGVTLHGWLMRPRRPKSADATSGAPQADAAPTGALIYFGGNAQEVSSFFDYGAPLQTLPLALMAVNYRGYGESGGAPSEGALKADALTLYDWLTEQPGIDPGRIHVLGRSLGSGVATYLASKRPVRSALLVTPYDSMVSVASRHYPWLPVSLLLRHRFESLALVPGIRMPLLALMAERDTIVPADLGMRLVQGWGGETTAVIFPGVGHNGIIQASGYWERVLAFLRRHDAPRAP